MSEDNKPLNQNAPNIDAVTLETVDKCLDTVDSVCRENNFDVPVMISMSVHVAAHLIARNLLLADGPNAREQLRTNMLNNVSEILDLARQHIDQSERELKQNGIVRPN